VVHASCEPHPCAMEPRMNGAPMMSLVRETKLWVGHPPEAAQSWPLLRANRAFTGEGSYES
jgi:hypothetical protein